MECGDRMEMPMIQEVQKTVGIFETEERRVPMIQHMQ